MRPASQSRWALILAGGDGLRLRSFIGDDRPKQFCPLLDGETLLACTRRRVGLTIRPDRHVVVVNRAHEPYYRRLEADLLPGRLVVQPGNRGTLPGILYPLLRIQHLAGDVPLAVFPSDHYVDDDRGFMDVVEAAFRTVAAHPAYVVLLGVEPDAPATEYGWIQPGPAPLGVGTPARSVHRFWEKPTPQMTAWLLSRGCLWNSFVMVGWLGTFVRLIERTVPSLLHAFAPARRALGTPDEDVEVGRLYGMLPALDFSTAVLTWAPLSALAVLPVRSVEWSDWGSPRRVVLSLLRRNTQRPRLAEAALA